MTMNGFPGTIFFLPMSFCPKEMGKPSLNGYRSTYNALRRVAVVVLGRSVRSRLPLK